jgi:glycosyltransferase involved in cell wall biosynthesis
MGHDSKLFVFELDETPADASIIGFHPRRDLPTRLRRRLRKIQTGRSLSRYQRSRVHGYETFSDDRSPYTSELVEQIPECDILHIQQMYEFVDYRSFFAVVPRHTPVVRSLHDVSFFAGGCHSPEGCAKYVSQCGACPQLGSHDPEDLSHQVWQRKQAAFEAIPTGRLRLVAPSRWLANEARRSSLLKDFSVDVIPHGVDTEIFRPRATALAREAWGIPPEARVVFFAAEPIHRPIKSLALLVQALEAIDDVPHLLLVSAGSGRPPVDIHLPYLNLGRLTNERMLSLAYNAADVFVNPSRQENFSLTVLEAMASGTPVVASDVGGIPDLVRPAFTGTLVPSQDMTALRDAIRGLLLDPEKRAEMGMNGRRVALEEFTLELQLQRHVHLYQAMLESTGPVARSGLSA